jgi:hypothetical protein
MSLETEPKQADVVPLGLRVAAGLCAAVGILSLFGALAVSVPLIGAHARTWIPLVLNVSAALSMCAAAVLAWRRRRQSLYAVIAAWALPTVANLLADAPMRPPSLLMVLAIIALAMNWHEFRGAPEPSPRNESLQQPGELR